MVEGCGETLPFQYSGVGRRGVERCGVARNVVAITLAGVVVAQSGDFCARARRFRIFKNEASWARRGRRPGRMVARMTTDSGARIAWGIFGRRRGVVEVQDFSG